MREGWGNGWGEQRRFEGRFEGSPMGGGMRRGVPDWEERGMRDDRFMRERDDRFARDYGPMRDERSMGWGRSMPEERGRGGWERGDFRGEDERERTMGEAAIVKVIEVVAHSPHSWEDATRRAVAEASRTIHDIKSIWVKDMQAIVSHDRVVEFRLVAKISFAIHPPAQRGGRGAYA